MTLSSLLALEKRHDLLSEVIEELNSRDHKCVKLDYSPLDKRNQHSACILRISDDGNRLLLHKVKSEGGVNRKVVSSSSCFLSEVTGFVYGAASSAFLSY